MQITLVGMSNIGKTHWANSLVSSGYQKIDCDKEVEKRLGYELTKLGLSGIHDVAKWMGQPYDTQYVQNSRKFVEQERAVMREAIDEVLFDEDDTSYVIDSSGSIIYVGDEIIRELKDLTLIVYLEASPDYIEQLFERYMKEPKPVVWGSSYNPRVGESQADSLKRCYPELLANRAKLYKNMAHVTIPYAEHKKPGADLMEMINLHHRAR